MHSVGRKLRLLHFVGCTFAATMAAVLVPPAIACSTFALATPHGLLFGRNADGPAVDGMLVVNKRGIRKVAAPWQTVGPSARHFVPARWTSRFGSLTFTHFGREFPDGGINEAGLIVEEMSLDSTKYPDRAGTPTISNHQWIQYQLDNYSSVAQVVANAGDLNIRGWPWHFTVADPTGACAVIEFIGGEPVISLGDRSRPCVLTNDPLQQDKALFRNLHAGRPGSKLPQGTDSFSRFARVSALLQRSKLGPVSTPDFAFGILSNVAQGPATFRSIVYDVGRHRVFFRSPASPQVKYVDLQRLKYGPNSPVMTLDINIPGKGDVTARFTRYSAARNRQVVAGVFKLIHMTPSVSQLLAQELRTAKLSEAQYIDRIANYPSSTVAVHAK